MSTASISTASAGSNSSGLDLAHPPTLLGACFGWCSVWCYPLTRDEVAQRQSELEQMYPGSHVCVSPMGEYVMLRR